MSRSLSFWNGLLGLPIIWQTVIPGGLVPGDPANTIMGAPAGATMHVAWVALPQTAHAGGSSDPQHISTIELTQFDLPADLPREQESRTLDARSWDVGFAHINLMVQNLDDLLKRASEQGWELINGIFTVPQDSPEVKARGQRICYVRGPDGEVVELVDVPAQPGL